MSRPQLGVQITGPEAATLRERARHVEALGFDAVSLPDHQTAAGPAALLGCAVIAEATSRVAIGTLVLNNDFRHPALLAREAALLAEMTGGRFVLGLGAGYAKSEYEEMGLPYDPGPVRVARLCESVQIVRRL